MPYNSNYQQPTLIIDQLSTSIDNNVINGKYLPPSDNFTKKTSSRVSSVLNLAALAETNATPSNLSLDNHVDHKPTTSDTSSTYSSVCKPSLATMPNEILTQILQEVILDSCNGNPANYYSTIANFAKILTTCSAIYDVGTPILYRHVAFSHPISFSKFLKSIENTGYGVLTRTLDFSGFTSVGLGRTGRMNKEIQMLTSSTILKVLNLCPNLNEFLGTENIDQDIDANVAEKLFHDMPNLQAVDFCGSTNSTFVSAIAHICGYTITDQGAWEPLEDRNALAYYSRPIPNLTRLSLHGCSTLPPKIIGALLQRLPALTRLDLTHTQTTSEALLSLPQTARLTHLSISKCVKLTSEGVLKFLVLHKATRSLEWLNMMFEATRPSPISAADLDTILRYLPPVTNLNLHGLPLRNLNPLTTMPLDSLSLGYVNVSIEDLKRFLPKMTKLEYLDLTGNPNINIWTVQDLTLLNANKNIRMFEFSRDLISKLDGIYIPGFKGALGQGRRAWLFRGPKVPVNKETHATTYGGPSAISGSKEVPLTPTSPQLQPTQAFTFSAYAKNKLNSSGCKPSLSPIASPETRPVTVLGMDMGSPSWRNASRKVNVCFIGLGGNMTDDSCKERGIYLYYGYRK